MSWLILVESMSVQHTLPQLCGLRCHRPPGHHRESTQKNRRPPQRPQRQWHSEGRSHTKGCQQEPNMTPGMPHRYYRCMLLWAMGQGVVEICISKSSCMDGVGFCVPSGLFQVSGGQQRRQSFLFEATGKTLLWHSEGLSAFQLLHFAVPRCARMPSGESLVWSLENHLLGTLLTPSSSAPCRSLPSQQLAAIPPTWS